MRKSNIIISAVILISFVVGIYYYPQMPDKMASHWNAQGQVDGYMSKFWGLFLMPIISVGLFMLIPKIDPLKENIEKFRKYFDGFIVIVVLFLLYIYILILLWNLGRRFDMGQALAPSIGLLFYFAGILIENSKRNWFIGIRTPWTLSSESVWDKTHRIGGRLFKAAGLIAFFGVFTKKYAILIIVVPIVLVSLYTIVYSYFEYQKETKLSSSG
jgi:uncharacterized membrane protein